MLSGTLSKGQIAVDLGEDAKKDPNAVVTLVLNGVNITSTVAPGIVFYNVYECGSDDTENAGKTVDTTKAGANISIADNTENTLNGSYVAKIYKSVVLSDDGKEITESKKLHKYDGSIYSNMSLNIDGDTGILNVNAENEGIESALHLTVNGGIINVVSGDDGLNSNEDNVSVTTINGGTLNIKIRKGTAEGDGIDSNGYIVINGGNIIAQACSTSGDSGIDSDKGIYINGGTVIATGNMLDRIAGGAQNYAVFTFRESQKDSKTYEIQNNSGESVIKFTSENSFTYLVVSSPKLKGGDYSLLANGTVLSVSESESGGMQGGFGGERPNGDEGGQRPEDMSRPDGSNGTTPPEVPNGERPQMPGNQENNPPEMPSGEAPEMPNGETPEMPNGEAPTDNGNTQTGKTVFNLNAGGNNYTVY